MDTTHDHRDSLARVDELLERVVDADPAKAVGPLTEIADLLEVLLDGEARH